MVIADADDDVADFGDVADDANVDLSDNEVNPKGWHIKSLWSPMRTKMQNSSTQSVVSMA